MSRRKKRYVIKKGAHLSKAAFKDLVPIMERLAEQHALTARALLDVARNPKSPAHRHFEWSDKKAAEEYRLVQARFFIRSIEIVVVGVPKTRAFHEVEIRPDVQRFEATDIIMASQELSAQLIERAKEDLRVWRLRYSALRRFSELENIFAAVDAAVDA